MTAVEVIHIYAHLLKNIQLTHGPPAFATIACAHRAATLLNVNDDEDVKLALEGPQCKSQVRRRKAKALRAH
jgi:hypothetical protein